MLVVTAEIWPGGDQDRAVLVGEIRAANIINLSEISNYAIEISQRGDHISGIDASNHAFQVTGHRRSKGVWELVRRIITPSHSHSKSEQALITRGESANTDERASVMLTGNSTSGIHPASGQS